MPGQLPRQPASSSSTLESSLLGASGAGRLPCEEEEGEEEGLSTRGEPLEQPMCSEEEEDAGSLDEFLLEDEQVEDFASSMLAAISCWHYTVQAFLSSTGMVRLSAARRSPPPPVPPAATQ